MPHGGHLARSGSPARKRPSSFSLPCSLEAFVGLGEQPPAPIEGIGLSAAVAHGLVLHPPAALVELGVGELAHMEGIGHLGGVGHHVVEDRPIGTGQIEGGPARPVSPLLPLCLQPLRRPLAAATRDDVEELAGLDVDDLGRELLAVKGPDAGRRAPRRGPGPRPTPKRSGSSSTSAVAIGDDGVVHCVPVTAELDRDLVDASRVAPHLLGDPAARPVGHRHAGRGDPGVLFGPAATGQSASAQHQRRLCQMRRVGRPKTARSTSSTTGRSFTRAITPQVSHPGRPLWSRRAAQGSPSSPSIPSTLTSGKPTK